MPVETDGLHVWVDQDLCTGDGLCVQYAPEVFEFDIDGLAYVKDRFGFKPLVLAETEDFVALATEEVALRQALGGDFVAREPAPGTMRIWSATAARVDSSV